MENLELQTLKENYDIACEKAKKYANTLNEYFDTLVKNLLGDIVSSGITLTSTYYALPRTDFGDDSGYINLSDGYNNYEINIYIENNNNNQIVKINNCSIGSFSTENRLYISYLKCIIELTKFETILKTFYNDINRSIIQDVYECLRKYENLKNQIKEEQKKQEINKINDTLKIGDAYENTKNYNYCDPNYYIISKITDKCITVKLVYTRRDYEKGCIKNYCFGGTKRFNKENFINNIINSNLKKVDNIIIEKNNF